MFNCSNMAEGRQFLEGNVVNVLDFLLIVVVNRCSLECLLYKLNRQVRLGD